MAMSIYASVCVNVWLYVYVVMYVDMYLKAYMSMDVHVAACLCVPVFTYNWNSIQCIFIYFVTVYRAVMETGVKLHYVN